MIDLLASGNSSATEVETPNASAAISTTLPRESPNLPSTPVIAVVESITPQVADPNTDSGVESSSDPNPGPEIPPSESPNLPSAPSPAVVESSASQFSDSKSEKSLTKSNFSFSNEDEPAIPDFQSSEFIRFFQLHDMDLDLNELGKHIAKSPSLEPYNLKGVERLDLHQRHNYNTLLYQISKNNKHIDQTTLHRISLQNEQLYEGINLKPTTAGLSRSAILYDEFEEKFEDCAEVIDILIAIKIGEVLITKASKKTLSHLYDALWAGSDDTEIPLNWSKSTK